jgi:hypothetical protein
VNALNTALDGYRATNAAQKAQLDALLAGTELPPAVQGQLQDIMDTGAAAIKAIDDTFAENFPTTPTPPAPPEVIV